MMLIAFLDISQWLWWTCVAGIGFCWWIQIASAFRHHERTLGIMSIALTPIGGFIIGWAYARRWRLTQIMVAFTGITIVLFVLSLQMMYEEAGIITK